MIAKHPKHIPPLSKPPTSTNSSKHFQY